MDAIQAMDVQSIEEYSAVKLFPDLQLWGGSFAGIICFPGNVSNSNLVGAHFRPETRHVAIT